MKKQFALMFLSLLVLSAFFLLPGNRHWARRLTDYGNEIKFQVKNMTSEQRMARRFKLDYTLSMQIADSFKKKNIFNPLVLLPPTAVFRQAGYDYIVPEPAVFYYFTGLHTVSLQGPHSLSANWIVSIRDKQIILDPVANPQVLKDSLASYRKKWKP